MATKEDFQFEKEEGMRKTEVKDILMEGEEILVELTPNKKDYVLESILKGLPFVLIWLAFDVFFIVMICTQSHLEPGFQIGIIIPFFAFHLLPVWLYIAKIVKVFVGYKNIKYVFTDRRVIIRSGVIGVDFKYFFYSDIDAVRVEVGLLDKLFKVGDIHITSKTQTAILEDVDKPYEYANRIQIITNDIKADIEYPNALRPEENPGYTTKYKGKGGNNN